MKVAVIGRGNVGGGLAKPWEAAGHDVTALGHEGGDVSGSEAILVACPSGAIEDALEGVEGIGDTPVIDATNVFGSGRPEGFQSLAEFVKSQTSGPVAKAFNANFAALYDRLGEARVPPSMVFAADEEARAVTEQLIRDAGYEPVYAVASRARARSRTSWESSSRSPRTARARSGTGSRRPRAFRRV